MKRTIDNTQDILDGRDVIRRLEELQAERATLAETLAEAEAEHKRAVESGAGDDDLAASADSTESAESELADWDEEYKDELAALESFVDEGSGEWRHGETLIRESYFTEYAQQLAEDIGALEDCDKWPATCIDWDKAAQELMADYTSAEFDGVTYYFRQ